MSETQEGAGVLNLVEAIQIQEDAVVSRTLIKSDAGTVTLFAFDQNQELSEHTAPFDALVHVLEGVVEIRIAQEIYRVAKGELLTMHANIPHALKAIEPFKMILTMIKG